MAIPPFRDRRAKALLTLAAALALLAVSPPKPLDVDVALHGKAGGHALIRLGFASIKLVFDSGQECSNSNGCAGTIL